MMCEVWMVLCVAMGGCVIGEDVEVRGGMGGWSIRGGMWV